MAFILICNYTAVWPQMDIFESISGDFKKIYCAFLNGG